MGAEAIEKALGEKLERVFVYPPSGAALEIARDELIALDLGGLAVAFKRDGKIHRMIGFPMEAISIESRIHTV